MNAHQAGPRPVNKQQAMAAGRRKIAAAETPMLLEALRLSDSEPTTAQVALVRGWLADELELRMPGIVDCWCDRLDAGEQIELVDMFTEAWFNPPGATPVGYGSH